MATEWFHNDGSGVAVHTSDPSILLVGDYIPDWIMIPAESPIRPGEKARVIAWAVRPCPTCRKQVRHLQLDCDMYVAECKPGCGFLLYRKGS